MKAWLCSDMGHPAPPTSVDVDTEGTSVKAHRETRSGFSTYRPGWLDMTIEDALVLRQELNRLLSGRMETSPVSTVCENCVRLQAERDSLKTDVSIISEASMNLLKEIDSLKADFAAEALENAVAVLESNPESVLDEVEYIVTDALSLLGTGEALAAVRYAEAFLKKHPSETGWNAYREEALSRLRAAFGEGRL